MSVSISLLVLLPCFLNLWVSVSFCWLWYLCAIPGNLIHSLNVNEIISLDNLSDCKQGWLLAFYHVSLLLAVIGTYIWLYMTLIDWCYCFGHQTATAAGVARVWLLPCAQNAAVVMDGPCSAACWVCVWVCVSHLLSSVPAAGLDHLLFWKVFFPVIFQSHSLLLEFPPASLPTHLTAVVEGCLFRRSHTDVCLCCGVSLTYWHVQVGTCVSKRLFWSRLRKSPGTWIIYGFMQTDKHKC